MSVFEKELQRLQADALRIAAEHLEQTRIYTWNARERKVNGWASAARELRRVADELEPS